MLRANSGDPDQTQRSAASDLGLQCLFVSQKRTLSLYWPIRSRYTYYEKERPYEDQSFSFELKRYEPQHMISNNVAF